MLLYEQTSPLLNKIMAMATGTDCASVLLKRYIATDRTHHGLLKNKFTFKRYLKLAIQKYQ